MLSSPLWTDFFKLSQPFTIMSLALLAISFIILNYIEKKKIDFSVRMVVALVLGVLLGFIIQTIAGFPNSETIKTTPWIQETIFWYGLFGSAFVSFIRMLVFPIILASIIHVMLTLKEGLNISTLIRKTLFWLLFTTGIAAGIGVILSLVTNLGSNMGMTESTQGSRSVINFIDILLNLIPSNPIKAMNQDNVISIVIFAFLVGSAARIMRSKEKYQRVMNLFADFIEASYRVVMSMSMTIIKFMPYGVVALMSRTLISYGLAAIQQALLFIALIYGASVIMMLIYAVILIAHGLNPIKFFQKATPAFLMAFSSRSSVGTLPVTVSTLQDKLGVNTGTANFVASLGSTMGMNGCAGYFTGMVAIMIAVMTGTPIDSSFIIMVIIIAALGSLGIAGIPGSATMAASIMLAGIGLSEHFHLLAIVLAVDPVIDMARTLSNVTGSMISAISVDKEMGTLDLEIYNN